VFLLESGIFDNTYVIGFTGSPSRDGNQRQLGMDYEEIVNSETVEQLIEYENLVRCRYFEVPCDISGLDTDPTTGDFTPKSQYKKFDSPEIYGKMIWNYKTHAENRQFICFCSNIPHAIKTCLEFNKEGIPTKFVVSKLNAPKPADKSDGGEWERYLDRKEAYELYEANKDLSLAQSEVNHEFISGRIQGVITINILSTGWDYRPLSCEILYRATKSKSLLTQMYGRVQRPSKGKKDAIVLDMGTNVARLGIAEIERPVSLWHLQSDSIGIAPEKICEGVDKNGRIGCGRSVLASLSICKCGFRFATEKEMREVELIERLKEEPTDYREMSATALRDLAELKGWSKPKLFRILYSRGESEFRKGMRELGYQNNYIYRVQEMYKKKPK
jgi:superfamily II DNA or RNA helicase